MAQEVWEKWLEDNLCDLCLAMSLDGWGDVELLCGKCKAKYEADFGGDL
jgi:hypothetical protein